ncbi:flavodoxin domain-containing protein [Mycolicibacterium sp. ELW1]|uniref:flavodoxin domain-containing protein n=1 Tax=Mycobacteriaceae TaxID=1762 RepID=UPI0011EDAA54|nr:flavodoxin domain-containing protein [Mycobacterium sp. ELW1]QEN14730.1 flavodoxin [Mycobacterium sp. ELW1]
MKRVLVAYGSTRGGTAKLAAMIGEALTEAGLTAVVMPARDVMGLADVDAVIVAGALYANRWHRDARRFVRRHSSPLRDLPVWLVSSGPLDDSAARGVIAPTRQVAKLIERVGARGHQTFGGSLATDARGFPASAMARTRAGDWTDVDHVRRWVATIAQQLVSADAS